MRRHDWGGRGAGYYGNSNPVREKTVCKTSCGSVSYEGWDSPDSVGPGTCGRKSGLFPEAIGLTWVHPK